MEIKNKVAVITGAASGIGQAISYELVRRGAKAIAMVDQSDNIQAVASRITDEFGASVALPYQGDVTDSDFRAHVFSDMREKFGLVSICIPAAGITRDALAVKVDKTGDKVDIYPLETFRFVTEINLIAPVYWTIEMIAQIAEARAGKGLKKWSTTEGVQAVAVFIGSISSQGNKGQVSYASAKSGLEGAAATLAKEAIFHGVRCCVIHPGFTDTPMVRAMGEEYINKYVLPDTQLGRLICPSEIADAICFMVTNSAVSGELWADAGWHPSPM